MQLSSAPRIAWVEPRSDSTPCSVPSTATRRRRCPGRRATRPAADRPARHQRAAGAVLAPGGAGHCLGEDETELRTSRPRAARCRSRGEPRAGPPRQNTATVATTPGPSLTATRRRPGTRRSVQPSPLAASSARGRPGAAARHAASSAAAPRPRSASAAEAARRRASKHQPLAGRSRRPTASSGAGPAVRSTIDADVVPRPRRCDQPCA